MSILLPTPLWLTVIVVLCTPLRSPDPLRVNETVSELPEAIVISWIGNESHWLSSASLRVTVSGRTPGFDIITGIEDDSVFSSTSDIFVRFRVI